MKFDREHLETLAAGAAGGTFDAAGRQLSVTPAVTPSVISQRIRALEPSSAAWSLCARSRSGRPQSGTRATPARSAAGGASRGQCGLDGDLAATGARGGRGAASGRWCTIIALGRMRYRPVASPEFATRWFPHGVDASLVTRSPPRRTSLRPSCWAWAGGCCPTSRWMPAVPRASRAPSATPVRSPSRCSGSCGSCAPHFSIASRIPWLRTPAPLCHERLERARVRWHTLIEVVKSAKLCRAYFA